MTVVVIASVASTAVIVAASVWAQVGMRRDVQRFARDLHRCEQRNVTHHGAASRSGRQGDT